MTKTLLTQLTNTLLKRLDFMAVAGLGVWAAIFNVLEKGTHSWIAYVQSLVLSGLILAAGLIFTWYKEQLKRIHPAGYLSLWLLCFAVLPFGIILFMNRQGLVYEALYFAPVWVALTDLALSIDLYYRNRIQHVKWVKKVSLENAVLVSILLISLALSVMGASSLNDPAYHTETGLLIGFEFKPGKIFRHFFSFLSFFIQFSIMYLCGYLFFIINSRFLVSKVLKEKGIVLYLLSSLTVVAILYPPLSQLLIALPINRLFGQIIADNPFKSENAAAALGIILVSLPIVLALQWNRQNTRIVSLEKEKTQTELDLLKQQLNPHFFFNTLNNLYALSLQKSDKAPESILQLSELMRYIIYKAQEASVPLSLEIKHIEEYIHLQQIRLNKSLRYEFSKDIRVEEQPIAPLLLIVLVENAFKHGIEPAEDAADLLLHLECDERRLYFRCQNSFETQPGGTPGIGLSNLRRRLELVYPGKHELRTESKNGIFTAELTLNLA